VGVTIYPYRASWSYGGFNRFRHRLAAEEGINLDAMQGFGGEGKWETSNGDPITPLAPLLNHSDCDGILESWDCELVEPRLSAILARWATDPSPEARYDVEHGLKLAAAMRHSVEHGCAVTFA